MSKTSAKFNPPIGLMSSIAPTKSAQEIASMAARLGMQAVEYVSIKGPRSDNVAFHIDPDTFGYDQAQSLIDHCNEKKIRIATVGCYANPMQGSKDEQIEQLNHMLKMGRVVAMLNGKDGDNDVDFGYFPGWDPDLGGQRYGFQKNLMKWRALQLPILKYNDGLGIWSDTENCPGEGNGKDMEQYVFVFNNLAAELGPRKMMYKMADIANVKKVGETHDYSHKWDGGDGVEEIKKSDPKRIRRIHAKTYRDKPGDDPHVINWGRLLANQAFTDEMLEIAQECDVPMPADGWSRCAYICEHPGFNGNDAPKWRDYFQVLKDMGYSGPIINELEAAVAKWCGNEASIDQALRAASLYFAPLLYELSDSGYIYDNSVYKPMSEAAKPGPIITIDKLVDAEVLNQWIR